jgi:hypothetical protein
VRYLSQPYSFEIAHVVLMDYQPIYYSKHTKKFREHNFKLRPGVIISSQITHRQRININASRVHVKYAVDPDVVRVFFGLLWIRDIQDLSVFSIIDVFGLQKLQKAYTMIYI